MSMFQVITNNPVAIDSDDHKFPEGVFYDNRVNLEFIESVENYFQRKIYFMDQGCAGGALVLKMKERGHFAIGLEGSDQIVNPSSELLKEMGQYPHGYLNWQNASNKNLFTCDLTKPYQVFLNGSPCKFDLITSWDVMEHFNPGDVKEVVKSVVEHLDYGGVFVASIAIFHATRQPSPLGPGHLKVPAVDYHKSVYPKEWWQEQLFPFLREIKYPFSTTNRPLDYRYYLFAGQKYSDMVK